MRRYLIAGQTGVGKSSFINAVFGIEVAKSDPFEPTTKVVEHYKQKTPLGDICLIDTPGLSENIIGSDRAYLDLVSKAIAQQPVHVMLYVSRLDDPRFSEGEQETLRLITQHLGSLIWQKSWLILTHAASVPEERFEETAKVRIEQISTFLQALTRSTENSSLVLKNSALFANLFGSTSRVESHRFDHFKKILLIDNINASWNVYALPTTTFQGFAWNYLSPRTIELIWKGGDEIDG